MIGEHLESPIPKVLTIDPNGLDKLSQEETELFSEYLKIQGNGFLEEKTFNYKGNSIKVEIKGSNTQKLYRKTKEIEKIDGSYKTVERIFQVGKKIGEGSYGSVQNIEGVWSYNIKAKKFSKKEKDYVIKLNFESEFSSKEKDLSDLLPHLHTKSDDAGSALILKKFPMTLDDFLESRNFTLLQRFILSKKIALALQSQVHNYGLIHRDLTPKNIMINYSIQKGKMVVDDVFFIDFGLSRLTSSNEPDSCGTVSFLSSEQVKAWSDPSIRLTNKSDIYAVGLLLEIIWGGSGREWRYGKSDLDLYKILRDKIEKKESIDTFDDLFGGVKDLAFKDDIKESIKKLCLEITSIESDKIPALADIAESIDNLKIKFLSNKHEIDEQTLSKANEAGQNSYKILNSPINLDDKKKQIMTQLDTIEDSSISIEIFLETFDQKILKENTYKNVFELKEKIKSLIDVFEKNVNSMQQLKDDIYNRVRLDNMPNKEILENLWENLQYQLKKINKQPLTLDRIFYLSNIFEHELLNTRDELKQIEKNSHQATALSKSSEEINSGAKISNSFIRSETNMKDSLAPDIEEPKEKMKIDVSTHIKNLEDYLKNNSGFLMFKRISNWEPFQNAKKAKDILTKYASNKASIDATLEQIQILIDGMGEKEKDVNSTSAKNKKGGSEKVINVLKDIKEDLQNLNSDQLKGPVI